MRASYCNICGLFILVHACFIQCSLWVITIIFSFQVVRNFTWTLISDAVMLGRLVITLKASFFRRQTWSFLGGKSVVCFPLLLLSSSNKKYMRIGFEFFTWKLHLNRSRTYELASNVRNVHSRVSGVLGLSSGEMASSAWILQQHLDIHLLKLS